MKTTRTQFLTAVATGVAATALTPWDLLGAGSVVPQERSFQALVGETFRFRDPQRRDPVNFVLTEYAERPSHSVTKQFTLTFAAPGGEILREGTYTVDHPRLGTFEVFIVPSGQDAKGQLLYRADFNLIVAVGSSPVSVRPRR